MHAPATPSGSHAIVIGAGMGGLVAARVLSSHFDRVTILERDTLGDTFDTRRGVPQGAHAHALLAMGLERLKIMFPGIQDDLVAARRTHRRCIEQHALAAIRSPARPARVRHRGTPLHSRPGRNRRSPSPGPVRRHRLPRWHDRARPDLERRPIPRHRCPGTPNQSRECRSRRPPRRPHRRCHRPRLETLVVAGRCRPSRTRRRIGFRPDPLCDPTIPRPV